MTRRAFTLIEIVLVIVIVSLLITLLLPTLRTIRNTARDAVSLSNMRSHTTVFQAYANDWNEHLPYVTRPDVTTTIIRGCGGWGYAPYFTAAVVWPIPLADAYYGGRCQGEEFLHPAQRGDVLINYMLSTSTLAEPAYWDLTTRTGPNQWAPQRLPKVQFPAAKAILVEIHPVHGMPYQSRRDTEGMPPVGMAAVDGSAGRWKREDLIPGVTSGEGIYDGIYLGQGVYGMHTINGVLGRDIKR